MFKAVLFLMLILPGVSCLISDASAEKPQQQPANIDLVEILFKYGSSPYSPTINKAMEEKDYEAVNFLIEHGVDLDTREAYSAFVYAYVDNGKEHVQGMTQIGQSTLELAIEHGKKSLIKKLLSKGANPYLKRNVKCITRNAQRKVNPGYTYYEKSTGKALEYGSFITTAVYNVIMTENLELLTIFAEAGVDFNQVCVEEGNSSYTPLLLAIELKNKKIAQFLLDNGAKI